jgi:peptidoglycan hydrolase-like protein with peptidoglycan-binding domain
MQKRARWTISAAAAAGLFLTGAVTAFHDIITPAPGHTKLAANSSVAPTINLDNCPTLTEGYHGGCVDQLQSELNADDHANLGVDGTFGAATRQAVITFQQEHGVIPADGIVGSLTKGALDGISTSIAGQVPVAPTGTPTASAPTPAPIASEPAGNNAARGGQAAGNGQSPGLAVVVSPPSGNGAAPDRHEGVTSFGPHICAGPIQGTNVTVCQDIGGDFVMADYAARTGHNEYITRMGAEFVSVTSIHNPWIDFDYYSTDGQVIYHWQGPPHQTSHEYLRHVYTPIAGNYYDFAYAGNLCATLYDNPGQFPVKIARACVSVGPQS